MAGNGSNGLSYNYYFLNKRSRTIMYSDDQGVKKIEKRTQFYDPSKKKNGMNSLEGVS